MGPYDLPSVDTLADEADWKLLRSIAQCQSYVLRHLLKEKPTLCRCAFPRVRSHNFILPLKENRHLRSRAIYHAICPRRGKLSVKTVGKTSGKTIFYY